MSVLPRLLLGLVCGWILARLRLVPGDAWLDGAVVDAQSAHIVRGAALVFVGLALRKNGRDVGVAFLVGLAAAVLGHGLLLGGPFGKPAFDLLGAAVVLGLLTWKITRDEGRIEPEILKAHIGERIGLFVAGGGAAIVLEVVARHVRLFGGGLAQDDSVFAGVFALLVALGGVCFGWIANLKPLERWAFPWLVAAAAATTYWSLATLAGIAQTREFGLFLARYGLDTSWHGTLAVDALVAGAVFVVPAFLLGLALRGARGAGNIASLLIGAGVGLALLPLFLRHDADASTAQNELFSAQFLPFGLLVVVLGAGLALLSVPGRSSRARWIAFASVVPLALPVLLADAKPLFVLSPWERRPSMPFLAFETPEGLATVEPGEGALRLATLDRRQLSPGLEGVRADTQTIQTSFVALPQDVRRTRAVRVLLVGQLTQARASVLAAEGAASIDRTGAWHTAMPRLESALLEDFTMLPGEIVAPDVAADRLAAGKYDLCIVLPVAGDPPRWRSIPPSPGRTVVVRWSSVEEPLLGGLPGSRFAGEDERVSLYVIAGSGLDQLRLGVLDGAPRPTPGAEGRLELVRLENEPSRPIPLTRLGERKIWRSASTSLATAEALARDDDRPLIRGSVSFARLQIPSSPFETESQQVEIDAGTLDLLRDEALAGPPSAYTREAWNWLARVLAGKREVAWIESHVAPIAARWAPWQELEIALSRADLEALDPQAAVGRLAPLGASNTATFEVLALLGDAHEQTGDGTAAMQVWRRALELRPEDRWIRRRLAMAQVRAGEAAGRSAVEALLAEEPEDVELRAFLGPAPWPTAQRGAAQDPGSH